MSYVQTSTCPKCGAPIYVPMMWHGIMPPPPMYSCACVPEARAITTTTTNLQWGKAE